MLMGVFELRRGQHVADARDDQAQRLVALVLTRIVLGSVERLADRARRGQSAMACAMQQLGDGQAWRALAPASPFCGTLA